MNVENTFAEKVFGAYDALLTGNMIAGSCCIQLGMVEAHNAHIINIGEMDKERLEYCQKRCVENAGAAIGGLSVKGVEIDGDWFASCFGLKTPDQDKLMAETVITLMRDNLENPAPSPIEQEEGPVTAADCLRRLPENPADV